MTRRWGRRRRITTAALLSLVLAAVAAGGVSTGGEPARPLALGDDRQLFVDSALVAELRGLTFRLHPPTPREAVMRYDQAWEGDTSWHPIVIQDGDRFRMWYRASAGNQDAEARTAYAESRDGINWTKPVLGLISFQGSTANNLVWPPAGKRGINLCVFKDGNSSAPAQERYKAIMQAPYNAPRGQAVYGLVSADGLRWRSMQEEPLLPELSDGPHAAFWDPWERHYVIYRRAWWPPGSMPKGNRTFQRTVSKDFRRWSERQFVDLVFGATPREQFYTSACQPYTRAHGVYLSFPMRFIEERQFFPDWPFPGLSDVGFLSSRDGIHWDRTFREAFIRPGLDPDNWHERSMAFGSGIVETGSGELSMYMTEHHRTGTAHIRRVTLRPDGFASIQASELGGELLTRTIVFAGKRLALNYSTSATGSVRVEILDSIGRPVPGYSAGESVEIFGDELDRIVGWRAHTDVSALAGQAVRLRFHLRDADLYAFRFVRAGS